jgi:hypothetical protein
MISNSNSSSSSSSSSGDGGSGTVTAISILPSLCRPNVSLTTSESEAGLDIQFTGSADMSAIDALDAYLEAIHALATKRHGGKGKRVKVDIRGLQFMSSSCFKSFVMWIGLLQDAPPSDRYSIQFKSNVQMHWQKRSLNALRCFATDLISVETS